MKKITLTLTLLTSLAGGLAEAKNISFSYHRFDPVIQAPAGTAVPLENDSGYGLKFIQFNDYTQQRWLDQVTLQGATPLQYYPHDTYLVWATTDQMEQARSQTHVRWTGNFAPQFKLSENLKGLSGTVKHVNIHFYNSGNPEFIINKLAGLGAQINNYFPSDPSKKLYDAIINIDARDFEKLAQFPEIISVAKTAEKPILDDESTSQVVAGNMDLSNVPELNYNQWLTDIDLDGAGVTWSITDTGVYYAHNDLNSRIVGGYNYAGCNQANPGDDPTTGGHGTHVAGIIGGDATAAFTDGDGYLYGLGVAPGYSIFAQNPICGTNASWPPAGGWQELSKQGVLGGAVGSNNSWTSGEGINHGYQATERTIDFAVRDGDFDTANVAEPYMWVFSAGNSGPGSNTLTSPKEAKNVIVTAGTQSYRVSGNVDAMYSSSSRGPSVDGRYVPTIAAPGQSVGSTMRSGASQCATAISGTNNQYALCSGTSMAAPHASGALVLLTQWWRENNGGVNPSPAMGKALLINSATDIDDGIPIPNFNEGWGRITLNNIFESTTSYNFYDQEYVFDNTGEEWQITRSVSDTNQPLRVTLTWSDAPGAIAANPALVNDLDLEVVTGGQTYLGNQFSNGTSVTGGTSDTLNNAENIIITNPGNTVTIRVKATNIAGDGVFYSGDITDQDFALVCNNCSVDPDFEVDINESVLNVCAPSDSVYNLDVVSINGYTDLVTLSSVGEPAGANVTFATNPITPGNATTMTISNTSSIAIGQHLFDVQGQSTSGTKNYPVSLSVFDALPEVPGLLTPIDGSAGLSLLPSFTWGSVSQGFNYTIEIDDDENFNSIDHSATLNDTQFDLNSALMTNTIYYWRVKATNDCGESQYSAVYSFSTEAEPGQCAIGTQASVLLNEDFESGVGSWTTGSNTGPATWALVNDNAHSGTSSMHADDVDVVSDQTLTSPAVVLPNNLSSLTLQFWNRQEIEDGGSSGCWDGGLLSYSTDGVNFTAMTGDKMMTDPYDGTLTAQYDNPQAGNDAWCGDPQDWLNSIVDIDDLAGETVTFRFHMATDDSFSHPGWHIDDVMVQGCEQAGPVCDTPPPTSDPDIIWFNGFQCVEQN